MTKAAAPETKARCAGPARSKTSTARQESGACGASCKAGPACSTPSGMPWKADHFRHAWAAASKEAGITDLHFHDLRGTTVTILSEQGANPQEIATITGHSLTTVGAILDKYSGRTLPLAEMAMAKLEKGLAGTFGEQIQQNASKTAKQRPTKKHLTA